jgi:hypothetical protein
MRACSVGVTLSEAELARRDAAIANKTKRARERTPLARLSPIRRGVQQSRGRAAGDSPVLEPANDPREQPATAPYVIRYPVNGTLEILPFKVPFPRRGGGRTRRVDDCALWRKPFQPLVLC